MLRSNGGIKTNHSNVAKQRRHQNKSQQCCKATTSKQITAMLQSNGDNKTHEKIQNVVTLRSNNGKRTNHNNTAKQKTTPPTSLTKPAPTSRHNKLKIN